MNVRSDDGIARAVRREKKFKGVDRPGNALSAAQDGQEHK
jgi:hypothetical protein